MSFRFSRAPKRSGDGETERKSWTESELIWGVPLRAGHDDQDDPKAHAGLNQHAFEPGNDERAICGFEPTKRATSPSAKPRPQLAVPSARLNPRCPKCARLITASDVVSAPPALVAAAEVATDVAAEVGAEIASSPAEPEETAEPPPADPVEPPLTAAPPPTVAPPPTPAPAPPERPIAWEGTAVLGRGEILAMVRPPSQPGLGVVASVVSGPAGTRVASVAIDADGIAFIRLSEPASAPVTVAWFVVPAVDLSIARGRAKVPICDSWQRVSMLDIPRTPQNR